MFNTDGIYMVKENIIMMIWYNSYARDAHLCGDANTEVNRCTRTESPRSECPHAC